MVVAPVGAGVRELALVVALAPELDRASGLRDLGWAGAATALRLRAVHTGAVEVKTTRRGADAPASTPSSRRRP